MRFKYYGATGGWCHHRWGPRRLVLEVMEVVDMLSPPQSLTDWELYWWRGRKSNRCYRPGSASHHSALHTTHYTDSLYATLLCTHLLRWSELRKVSIFIRSWWSCSTRSGLSSNLARECWEEYWWRQGVRKDVMIMCNHKQFYGSWFENLPARQTDF